MGEAIESLDLFRFKNVRRVKVRHLSAEVHLLPGEVEPFETAKARASRKETAPERVHAATEWGNRPHPRDDDAMRFAHRTIFPVRTVAARYASPASPRAVIASLTASVSYVAW